MERSEVYKMIDGEREYQDMQWGTVEQNPHNIRLWLKIALEELYEANGAHTDEEKLDELRQVAAVCIAALEQHGCPPREGKENGD